MMQSKGIRTRGAEACIANQWVHFDPKDHTVTGSAGCGCGKCHECRAMLQGCTPCSAPLLPGPSCCARGRTSWEVRTCLSSRRGGGTPWALRICRTTHAKQGPSPAIGTRHEPMSGMSGDPKWARCGVGRRGGHWHGVGAPAPPAACALSSPARASGVAPEGVGEGCSLSCTGLQPVLHK